MPDKLQPPPYAARIPGWAVEDVVALVDCASGADIAAIEALEAIAADLRSAADARAQLAAHVPPELLRQVLLTRSTSQPADAAEQGDQGDQDNGLLS